MNEQVEEKTIDTHTHNAQRERMRLYLMDSLNIHKRYIQRWLSYRLVKMIPPKKADRAANNLTNLTICTRECCVLAHNCSNGMARCWLPAIPVSWMRFPPSRTEPLNRITTEKDNFHSAIHTSNTLSYDLAAKHNALNRVATWNIFVFITHFVLPTFFGFFFLVLCFGSDLIFSSFSQ